MHIKVVLKQSSNQREPGYQAQTTGKDRDCVVLLKGHTITYIHKIQRYNQWQFIANQSPASLAQVTHCKNVDLART